MPETRSRHWNGHSFFSRSIRFVQEKLYLPGFWWPVVLTGLTLALYWQTSRFEFVNFDDDVHVYENDHVTSGLSWDGLRWAFMIHGPSQWHPLAWLSHQLDCQLFETESVGHHLGNVVFHVTGVILLYFAIHSLTGRTGAAAFIAAMFAIHPLNLESVAWISERRNVLCGAGWMAAVIAYVQYARRGRLKSYVWVTVWLTLALMAKPLAVTLPCVFLLLDFWPLQRSSLSRLFQHESTGCLLEACPEQKLSQLLLEKLPWLSLAAIAGWLSFLCQKQIQVVSDLSSLPLVIRLENACVAYGLYLRRIILPFDLAAFYPHPAWIHPQPADVLLVPAVVSGAFLLILSGVAIWQVRRHPGLLVGWLWFLGTLVPMLGLVQVGRQQLADRYVYIPMIGLGLMIVSLPWPVRSTRMTRSLTMVAVVYWFVISLWQISYWQNSKLLFARAIEVTDNNSWAHLNLGHAFQTEGNSTEAIRHYQRALEIDPEYALAHYNLGVICHESGRLALAIHHLRQAASLDASSVNSWLRLGGALGKAGQLELAEECFRKAISLDADSAQARFNLASVLQARGVQMAALAEFERSVEQKPDNIQYRIGWMRALNRANQFIEARVQAREILRQAPGTPAAMQILSANSKAGLP